MLPIQRSTRELRPGRSRPAARRYIRAVFGSRPAGSSISTYDQIEPFADWQGIGADGLNFVDELMAHETGHVLGIGTLWESNGVYVNYSFQYTGQYGVAAYRDEFDAEATFVPVENAGNSGTPNAHWDQRMRSSSQEGNPNDPWPLSPLTGVTDRFGRDRALELMTGAIDPDYGEPFLSNTTIQSLRDLGYTVVPEPSAGALAMGVVLAALVCARARSLRFW